MRKRVQYVIVLLIICCAYAAVLIFTQERQSSGNAPTISAPQWTPSRMEKAFFCSTA